jgi:(2Fe-2S) ferredoxin
MTLERYSFCFLRYVHEPLSGEFANVGVLLWAPQSRFLGFRASQKYRRLSHFFPGFQQQDHRQLIARIDTQFQKLAARLSDPQGELPFPESPESARDLALKVIPHDDAALQWSLSGGGLTESPTAELDTLFQEAVARHYDSVDEARRDDGVIYREIYSRAFESPIVKAHMSEHEVVAPLASHVFPQAWKNGVWNVYQPLSFDLKRGENIRHKAYHWESLTRFLAQSAETPKIHLLLGAPSGDQRKDYEKAKDVLRSSNLVNLVEEDQAADFASDLAQRVQLAS